MKNVLLKNKNVIKYSTIQDGDYKIKILGIGPKAIKYSINDGEDEFALNLSKMNIGMKILRKELMLNQSFAKKITFQCLLHKMDFAGVVENKSSQNEMIGEPEMNI